MGMLCILCPLLYVCCASYDFIFAVFFLNVLYDLCVMYIMFVCCALCALCMYCTLCVYVMFVMYVMYAMLSHAMPCYAMLCFAMHCDMMQRNAMQGHVKLISSCLFVYLCDCVYAGTGGVCLLYVLFAVLYPLNFVQQCKGICICTPTHINASVCVHTRICVHASNDMYVYMFVFIFMFAIVRV